MSWNIVSNWLTSELKSSQTRKRWAGYQFSTSNALISPDDVLSDSNRINCIETLSSMSLVKGRAKENLRNAAVLVSMCKVDKELALLYIVRALHLKINGGEVAFPGGMQEKHENLKDTALRETFEEIGITPDRVDVWGKGPEIHRPNLAVTPFLGYIGDLNIRKLKINFNEVSMVFPVSLNHLSSPENFRTTQFRFGKSNVFKTPVYLNSTKRIWGLTAMITHVMLSAIIPGVYKKNIRFDSTFHRILGIEKSKKHN